MSDDHTRILGLYSDGRLGGYNVSCSNTYGSRPAFLIPSDFAVEDDSNPLEGYSTNELVAEVNRRMNS